MEFIQRRINVDATSCDVVSTLRPRSMEINNYVLN